MIFSKRHKTDYYGGCSKFKNRGPARITLYSCSCDLLGIKYDSKKQIPFLVINVTRNYNYLCWSLLNNNYSYKVEGDTKTIRILDQGVLSSYSHFKLNKSKDRLLCNSLKSNCFYNGVNLNFRAYSHAIESTTIDIFFNRVRNAL